MGLFLGESQVLDFLQVFPLDKNFKVMIALTFGLFGNNTGVWKHLQIEKQNVPSNATSAFSCHCRVIILVKDEQQPF